MLSALQSDGPSPEIQEQDRIYGWLIGSWKVRVVDYPNDSSKRESTGEWHFGWVLEGRAVQDVWISPRRSDRTPSMPKAGNRYGTSVRVFHPIEKKWHVTWINPVSGAFDRLVARCESGCIYQEGRDSDGNLMRWVFADIQERSARWYGERSMDGGRTWKLEAEFFMVRE